MIFHFMTKSTTDDNVLHIIIDGFAHLAENQKINKSKRETDRHTERK